MRKQPFCRYDDLCKIYAAYPDRFELWCGFDYTGYDQAGFGPAAVKELQRCYRMGARGVGELGDKGKGLFYSKPTAEKGHSFKLPEPNESPYEVQIHVLHTGKKDQTLQCRQFSECTQVVFCEFNPR